jgi:hypothetical protein
LFCSFFYVQHKFSLSFLKQLGIKSIENTYRGDIDIKKDADIFIVNIKGTVEAVIKAGFGIIQSVSGC